MGAPLDRAGVGGDGRRSRTGGRRAGTRLLVVAVLVAAGLVGVADGARSQPAAGRGAERVTWEWRTVAAGASHTCAIRSNGRLYCWGRDTVGQLGDGGPNADRAIPTEVAGGHTDWTQVAVGGVTGVVGSGHTCGRRASGRLYCWGSDQSGQLGDGGSNADRATPTEVVGGHTDWTQVATGGSHTCGRRGHGRIYCWGADGAGQLGNGPSYQDRDIPVLVSGGATDWTSVTAGREHSCGRRGNGRLYCWGWDGDGQLGDGGAGPNQPTPVVVAGGATTWTQVDAGADHTCGRRSNGRLYCWGDDDNGQVGDGATLIDRVGPVVVAGGATDWKAVTAGDDHTCGRRSGGRLFCWGDDGSGQVGDGATLVDRPVPARLAGGATGTLVSAGGLHTCLRATTARLFCWGDDAYGQLGDGGINTDQPVPVPVAR